MKKTFTWLRIFNIRSISNENVVSIQNSLLMLAIVISIGVSGYMLIEGYSLIEAFYMTIITLSTVGYGEVHPLSKGGQLFTTALILVNIGVIAYIAAVVSYYVYEENILKNIHLNFMKRQINKLNDHVIICGYGRYGSEIVENLFKSDIDFVIIEKDHDRIRHIVSDKRNLPYVEADATYNESLKRAGVERARVVISALSEDADNLFVVISVKHLNPDIKVISRISHAANKEKFEYAGADHILRPEEIGGRHLATLVTKPHASEFFNFIASELDRDIRFIDLHYDDLPESWKNESIRELRIRTESGANILGHHTTKGDYRINPPPETKLSEGESFIILGTVEQMERLYDMIEEDKS